MTTLVQFPAVHNFSKTLQYLQTNNVHLDEVGESYFRVGEHCFIFGSSVEAKGRPAHVIFKHNDSMALMEALIAEGNLPEDLDPRDERAAYKFYLSTLKCGARTYPIVRDARVPTPLFIKNLIRTVKNGGTI